MNKSNNEIAQISGISLRTVQSQRYRLAKKLNLSKDQDLNSFIFIYDIVVGIFYNQLILYNSLLTQSKCSR